MLEYYSARLRTVEINNTFRQMPRASLLEGWRAKVPPGFSFAVKAPQRITHFRKLSGAEELVRYLFETLQALGPTLGPVLFQLPPTFRADVGVLQAFLELLPKGGRAAFEFRHPSWFDDETYRALEAGGAALVGGDVDEDGKSLPLVRTADFVYLRLRRTSYEPGDLEDWARRVRELGAQDVFAYFKHEQLGPELAVRLQGLLGE
jgi:uncharacterized protein YecE (DUF72 family)